MRRAEIVATGMNVPEQVVPNSFFNESLGEDVDTWLRENVKIYERRWCADNESTADLCERAANQTLERAGLKASDIDLIIIATDTPEFVSPSTASVVQNRIGATNAGTFDLNSACAGFVTALDVGSKYIQSDENYKHILVIGAYAMSKYLNKSDKKTVTLFADGAGAVVLKATDNPHQGFLGSQLITKGQYNEWMGIYAGATNKKTDEKVLENHDHELKFVRKFPKELNPEMWSKMTYELCDRLKIEVDEIDHFFITQININSIWEMMDILKQPREKAHTIMHNYGYTGSACIPLALNDAMEKGIAKKGELVVFIGSGGGLAFASAAFRL